MSKTNDVYTIVTEQIIASLEAGTVPWHKPWVRDHELTDKDYRRIDDIVSGWLR